MNFQNQIDYLQLKSEDILSGLEVPAPLQAETLKTQIVMRCGLLEPVYTEPEIMQTAIAQFFKREQWNITHLVNIILAEYSPIENTDRYSEHQIDRDGSRTTNSTGKDKHSGKDSRSTSENTSIEVNTTNSGSDIHDVRHTGSDKKEHSGIIEDTTTNTVSAYNSSEYQPDSKSLEEKAESGSETTTYGSAENDALIHGHRIDEDQTGRKSGTDDLTYGHTIDRTGEAREETSGTDKYVEHTHGNIGVTTNQDMIEQELQLLRHFDVYDWIAAKLENELFIQVY